MQNVPRPCCKGHPRLSQEGELESKGDIGGWNRPKTTLLIPSWVVSENGVFLVGIKFDRRVTE